MPTEDAARIALRTQQVIAFESGVRATADPLGGSYAVERLTTEIENLAEGYIAKIDAMGGTLEAIEAGLIQHEIDRAAYEYQKEVESGEKKVVGVNSFLVAGETPIATLRVDPRVERAQVERLQRVRQRTDGERANRALDNVERTAREGGNLLPPIIEAVEAFATVGEIADRLRSVFGEFEKSS